MLRDVGKPGAARCVGAEHVLDVVVEHGRPPFFPSRGDRAARTRGSRHATTASTPYACSSTIWDAEPRPRGIGIRTSVVLVRVVRSVDAIRSEHVRAANRVVAPPVVELPYEVDDPARHRHRDPRGGELDTRAGRSFWGIIKAQVRLRQIRSRAAEDLILLLEQSDPLLQLASLSGLDTPIPVFDIGLANPVLQDRFADAEVGGDLFDGDAALAASSNRDDVLAELSARGLPRDMIGRLASEGPAHENQTAREGAVAHYGGPRDGLPF